MEPRVFVLDEPSSNLDADSVLELRAVIAYMKSLGKTVVLSEHRLYYLHGLADRYVYMRGGRILPSGFQSNNSIKMCRRLRACTFPIMLIPVYRLYQCRPRRG